MKKAFTMIELVFVIVVIGILAAVIFPNTRTNPVEEAAISLLSQVRYTQHLAMVDDKYGAPNWFRNRWQITFNGNTYSIEHNNNTAFAQDPQTKQNIQGIVLNGLSNIVLDGDCLNETIISFDHLGRPLRGNLAGTATSYVAGQIVDANCTIILTNGTETAFIDIVPETGYSRIR